MSSAALRLVRRLSAHAKTTNLEAPLPQKETVVNTYKHKPFMIEPKTPRVKISILGADTKAGWAAGFLLKQHPLVGKVYLHGLKHTENIAKALESIDTSCRVEGYEGEKNIARAIRAADVVLIMDVDNRSDNISMKLNTSAPRIMKMAEYCGTHCPDAVFLICVEPVCCTVPIFEKILMNSSWFHPSRLIGSVTHAQTRANVVAANYLGLDPSYVHVPLLGGPDSETIVPAISLMTPQVGLGLTEIEQLVKLIKKKDCNENDMSEGFAAAKLAITVTRGLSCCEDAITIGLVSTNVVGKVRHFVTTIRFGEGGVIENYGIPPLTRPELRQLERALVKLDDRHNAISGFNIKKFDFAIDCCS